MTDGDQPRARFSPAPGWKDGYSQSSLDTVGPAVAESIEKRTARVHDPSWEYQWGDSLNVVTERQVVPDLATRICEEIARCSASGLAATIFVRGELGIGKTTLRYLLTNRVLRAYAERPEVTVQIANTLRTTVVLEGEDLETPIELAGRVNRQGTKGAVVLMGRPGTIDAASQWLDRQPTAVVTIAPFEPTRLVFRDCLTDVAQACGFANQDQVDLLAELASRLPVPMCTPFYFERLAEMVAASNEKDQLLAMSPLQILEQSITHRLGPEAYDDLVASALDRPEERAVTAIPGILDEDGIFRHDGYRNVMLASLTLSGALRFLELARLRNSLPAVRTLLDHLERTARSGGGTDHLIDELEEFSMGEIEDKSLAYHVYVQAIVANSLRRLRRSKSSAAVQNRCIELISKNVLHAQSSSDVSATLAWDVSDALSLLGDPRLLSSRRKRFAEDSGFFTPVDARSVEIGSRFIPARMDDAKPVLPYQRQAVNIGPFWVGNFLVTNEQYREFWNSPNRDSFFVGAGRQWVEGDRELLSSIEAEFDVAAQRCFWKEAQDESSADIAGLGGSTPILTIARVRALRQGRVALWDPTQADDRYSADGCPVVGVTWWEAVAFCNWWQKSKLADSGLPSDASVNLLSDWEWEACRRYFYEPASAPDVPTYATDRYAAHLRLIEGSPNIASGRPDSARRPLHVGLYPVPNGRGPFDMVGNVWEWTSSRVYGKIVRSGAANMPYGQTEWVDSRPTDERIAMMLDRDVVDAPNDLSYRAVRGASFFSIDPQAAWNPAYRLCDPPFSSYFDLGFRIAVHPRVNRSASE
jgi:formylglycine-generating enzyme required for sulfatase activity